MQAQLQTGVHSDERATIREWLANARLEGREDTYAGKRRYPRVTWVVPVTVEFLDGERAGENDFAMSKDISEGGVGLRCRRPLAVRTLVRVMTDEGAPCVHARVMHCTETLGGFIVGLEFRPQPTTDRGLRKSA